MLIVRTTECSHAQRADFKLLFTDMEFVGLCVRV